MTIVKNRIYNQLDMNQGREQAGFRKNFSTVDNMFVLNQIIEKTIEYNVKIIKLMFTDFKKAFDCVDHEYWIRVIRKMYNNTQAYSKLDKMGKEFKIGRGIRQGDPLSSNLFTCVIEEIFRNLNWEDRGIKINGEYCNNRGNKNKR